MFCHIVDDFYSQPLILSSLKQKSWWEENAPDNKYKHDYLMALFIHSFAWSFMIHVPIFLYLCLTGLIVRTNIVCAIGLFVFNVIVHFYVDDLKANKLKINLIIDQLIHILQIIITWFTYVILMKDVFIW